MKADISCPGVQHDHLYQADYDRQEEGASWENCDLEKLVNRLPRDSNDPCIHYGLVASGNRVMTWRDSGSIGKGT
jgi:hypothetical protein